MKPLQKILVPTDFSPTSGVALEAALSLATKFEAAVEVLHVWKGINHLEPEMALAANVELADRAAEEMSTYIASLELPGGVEMSTRVQPGAAARVITDLSPEYHLIVMGTHGRSGVKRLLLGSVAAEVVRSAACPVMTVREPGEAAASEPEIIVRAMFEDAGHLTKAFEALVEAGVPAEDVSLVMTEDTHDADFKALDRTKSLQGMTAGGLMGAAIGGVLGGVASLGNVVTGGLGLVIIGPALAFAAAGGLFGGLLGRTVPDDRAMVLKAELASGSTLMAVHLKNSSQLDAVRMVLTQFEGQLFEI